ncbi:hypothetical protein COL516b_009279 [Colletotrichum fioriniae]|nr:uncharacterized protein COL516b_009279 [Colletotrichum fioriniae]KAJ0299398.1 hypothetical protein COL516b_009279 [Colletotrichum fioriniae]
MPRPTTDRVIHDYTAKILPTTMILTLVIFTVVVLVYSIGEKAAVPRDAAVAFAGIVFGVSGLWLLGHLVMYCRGAQAVTPPPLAMPLPLTGIATGVGATTMAMPQAQVPQAAVDVVVPPAVHLHQPQQQQHQRSISRRKVFPRNFNFTHNRRISLTGRYYHHSKNSRTGNTGIGSEVNKQKPKPQCNTSRRNRESKSPIKD